LVTPVAGVPIAAPKITEAVPALLSIQAPVIKEPLQSVGKTVVKIGELVVTDETLTTEASKTACTSIALT